jgi:hypothetical protein
MKYFVLYTFNSENSIKKYYLKGKSMKHMEDRIKKYSNGMLVTSKWTLFTDNIEFGFLREVNPTLEFPHMTKREFVVINENRSCDNADLDLDFFM